MKKLIILAALPVAAACSSGGGGGAAAPQATYPGQGTQQQQQRFPGATGLLAAIDGHTLQVQSSSEQTAVTWSAKTTFTDTLRATAAAVAVGSCVNVRDNAARPRASSTPDPSATRPTTVTAVSVSVSSAVDGSCTPTGGPTGRTFGGLQGTPPPGFTPPSGAPTGSRGFFGGGANGKVVSKTATGFVVESAFPGQSTSTRTTVTTTGTTTYTSQQKATAAALKVGECVTARGQSDSSGTVAAASIAIRPKTGTTCDDGFGARRG